jgi:hypothetical protein
MEMAKTRKTLERVPEDKFGWKPHEKSMAMGRLTGHLAEIPMWAAFTINDAGYDVAPVGAPPPQSFNPKSLAGGAGSVRQERRLGARGVREYKQRTPDGAVVAAAWRNSHVHDALRLNDVPVPSICGPSADEQGM